MSDTFDHMEDAYFHYEDWGYDEYQAERYHKPNRGKFKADPLYYHTRWNYVDILDNTQPKLLLVEFRHHIGWVPRKLIRHINPGEKTMHIHQLYHINMNLVMRK